MSLLRVLHISDLHFGHHKFTGRFGESGSLKNILCKFLCDRKLLPIHAILVTGDYITAEDSPKDKKDNLGTPQENYDQCLDLLKAVVNIPSMKDYLQGVLLVPGNHDLQWFHRPAYSDATGPKKRILVLNEDGSYAKDKLELRMKQYITFKRNLTELLSTSCPKALEGHRRFENLVQKTAFAERYNHLKASGFEVQIWQAPDESSTALVPVGMNSVLLDCYDYPGMGWIGEEQTEALKWIAEEVITSSREYDEAVKVVALHHHVLPVLVTEKDFVKKVHKGGVILPDILAKKLSLSLDARDLLDKMSTNDYRAVFHGHQHSPSIVSWHSETHSAGDDDSPGEVCVVSAGAMGEKDSEGHFYLLDFLIDGIKINSFKEKLKSRPLSFDVDPDHEARIFWPAPFAGGRYRKCANVYLEPSGTKRMEAYVRDKSERYFLFFNTDDIVNVKRYFKQFANRTHLQKEFGVHITGIYSLWGGYDTLIVFCSSMSGDSIEREFVKGQLIDEKNFIKEVDRDEVAGDEGPENGQTELCESGKHSPHYDYELKDVKKEIPGSELNGTNKLRIVRPIRKQAEYEMNYFTRAFVVFELKEKDRGKAIVDKLSSSTKKEVLPIIEMAYELDQLTTIYSLLMNCQQSKALNMMSRALDEYIDKKRGERRTYIVYDCEEFADD